MKKEIRGGGTYDGQKMPKIEELPKQGCYMSWKEIAKAGDVSHTNTFTFTTTGFAPPECSVDVDHVADLLNRLGYDELEYISKVCEMIRSKMVLDQRV